MKIYKLYQCYEGELYGIEAVKGRRGYFVSDPKCKCFGLDDVELSKWSFTSKQEALENEIGVLDAEMSQIAAEQAVLNDKLAKLLSQSAKLKTIIQEIK